MKTADLIPLILLELKDGDKYGLEFSKDIETKSDARIVIKQPTLYTILKKLEKSKFITSYWLDSEIGGKRHYYKLTANGLNQVSTLPDINSIIESILAAEAEENAEAENEEQVEKKEELQETEILPTTPVETVIPSSEVFSNDNIDTLTEVDINNANTEVLNESNKNDSSFATNDNVSKFITSTEIPKTIIKEVPVAYEHNSLDLPESKYENENFDEVKFVEYTNISKTPEHLYAKKLTKRLILSSFILTMYILLATAINVFVVSFLKGTSVYYVTLILGLLVAMFYPITIMLYAKNNYFTFQNKKYDFSIKKNLMISAIIFLSVLLICIAVNIMLGNNTFITLLEIKNYPNFYAPVIIALSPFVNTIARYTLLKEISK